MTTNKAKQIVSFEKLSKEVQNQIKEYYPHGYLNHLVQFSDIKGNIIRALPFETEDKYYLVKINDQKAKELIFEQDDDFLDNDAYMGYSDKFDFDSDIDEQVKNKDLIIDGLPSVDD